MLLNFLVVSLFEFANQSFADDRALETRKGRQKFWHRTLVFVWLVLAMCGTHVEAQTTNTFPASGNVGIGTTAPDSKLVVTSNTGTLPPTTAIARFADADGVQTTVFLDGFNVNGGFLVRRANTTAAAPTAVVNGDLLGVFGAAGHHGSAYSGTRARVAFGASENWTSTANGTFIAFNTTANGATTAGGSERMRIDQAGYVGIGTITPTQNLDVAGNIVATGTQTLTTASKGVIEVTNTITNNATANAAFRARNIFNGNGAAPAGLDIVPTFSPSAPVALSRGGVIGGAFAPPSGVTITNAIGLNTVTEGRLRLLSQYPEGFEY